MPSSLPVPRSQSALVTLVGVLFVAATLAAAVRPAAGEGGMDGAAPEPGPSGSAPVATPPATLVRTAAGQGGGPAIDGPVLAPVARPAGAADVGDLPHPPADEAPAPEAAGSPYPHPVQFLTVLVGREPVRLAYMDVAPAAANGRTALLVHGDESAGRDWAPAIHTLADAGFRVIVPDLVGFGRSGRPEAPASVDAMAGHLDVLLDSLGAHEVSVVGTGLGGAVAVRLAARTPGMQVVALPAAGGRRTPGRAASFEAALLHVLEH